MTRAEQQQGEAGIDTADHVLHGPSGEKWLVGRVTDTHVHPLGWPPSSAPIADCTLVKKATATEREALLREIAAGSGPHTEWARTVVASSGPVATTSPNEKEPVKCLKCGGFGNAGYPCAAVGCPLAPSPATVPDTKGQELQRFLDAAAGEGLVLDGVDAADLYVSLFGGAKGGTDVG